MVTGMWMTLAAVILGWLGWKLLVKTPVPTSVHHWTSVIVAVQLMFAAALLVLYMATEGFAK